MPRTSSRHSVLANDPITHHAYHGYLIRWNIFTLDKPSNRLWIEKDNQFIAWANSVEDAKTKIDEVRLAYELANQLATTVAARPPETRIELHLATNDSARALAELKAFLDSLPWDYTLQEKE